MFDLYTQFTCSFEQAIALKKIGIRAASLFYFVKRETPPLHYECTFHEQIYATLRELADDMHSSQLESQLNLSEDHYNESTKKLLEPKELVPILLKSIIATDDAESLYPAFTSGEIGNMLPKMIVYISSRHDKCERQWELFCGKDDDECFAGFFNATIGNSGTFAIKFYDKNEAICKTQLLIWLIKNKLLTITDALSGL